MSIMKDRMDRGIKHDKLNTLIYKSEMQAEAAKNPKIKPDSYDPEIFNLGCEWFEQGHPLEDAAETIKNNTNFVRGYDLAMRRKMINDDFYRLGAEHFMNGHSLDEAPKKSLTNKYFIMGYEDAKNNNLNLNLEEENIHHKHM